VALGEPALEAVEQAGDQHVVAAGRVLARQLDQVLSDAPDGVADDQAAAPRLAGRLMPGVAFDAVFRTDQADDLAHGGAPYALSNSSRVRWRARSAASAL